MQLTRSDFDPCLRSSLLEAFPAKDRTPLGGPEGNCGFFPALGARGLGFGALAVAAAPAAFSAAIPGIPPGLATFASLRFVLEAFVGVKLLFAGCENEFAATVSALQNAIVIFHDAPRAVGSSTARNGG